MTSVQTSPRLELIIDPDAGWQIVCRVCDRPVAGGPYDSPDSIIGESTRLAVAHRCETVTERLSPAS